VTLDKHTITGVNTGNSKTLSTKDFESLLINAGYFLSGSAPAQGNRLKKWFGHKTYQRVEAIYSVDKNIVITAYHV